MKKRCIKLKRNRVLSIQIQFTFKILLINMKPYPHNNSLTMKILILNKKDFNNRRNNNIDTFLLPINEFLVKTTQ